MEEQNKIHVHLSTLISQARLQKGFSTLREFYREMEPSIDYQTWLHIESGRRVPAPATLVIIGDILGIPRDELIIAYCKDKFADNASHRVLNTLQAKGLFDVATLMHAKEYDRSNDYVFTAEQLKAMQTDLRIRLYLMYTYDDHCITTISRLSRFFGVDETEAQEVVAHLHRLGLVEIIGQSVKKIYPHTTIPITADIADLRKNVLLKSLDLTLEAESYISNYHVALTEKSYKKILNLIDFIEANLLQLEQKDQNDPTSHRYQIAIAGTKLREKDSDNTSQSST